MILYFFERFCSIKIIFGGLSQTIQMLSAGRMAAATTRTATLFFAVTVTSQN